MCVSCLFSFFLGGHEIFKVMELNEFVIIFVLCFKTNVEIFFLFCLFYLFCFCFVFFHRIETPKTLLHGIFNKCACQIPRVE